MRDFAGGKEGRTEQLGRGASFFLRFSLYQCTGELRLRLRLAVERAVQ